MAASTTAPAAVPAARIEKDRQSVTYTRVFDLRGAYVPYSGTPVHRCRVVIEVDSYDFQSSAVVQRWDGARWQEVARILWSAMASLATVTDPHAFRGLPDLEAFESDDDELVRRAAEVLA